MSAVETMDAPAGGGLVPAGVPVVSGRVHLGRLPRTGSSTSSRPSSSRPETEP